MGVSDATGLPLTNTKTKLDLTKHVISRQQSMQKYNFFAKLPNIFDRNIPWKEYFFGWSEEIPFYTFVP